MGNQWFPYLNEEEKIEAEQELAKFLKDKEDLDDKNHMIRET
jgi:hypothetical protein